MIIERFYDEALAQASYMVVAGDKAAVIDPARNPNPFYEFAKEKGAKIVAIIETHPHADFVSSHQEMARHTGGKIYVSELVGADYPHDTFDEGDVITLNDIKLKAIHTPGHSPDSISIVAEDENGKDVAVFTGDSLFIGDVGRADLREKAGNIQAKREEMAEQMYETIRNKFMKMDDDVKVMPAHGAGSLCGKNMSDELESTIGKQKKENWAFKPMSKEEFVDDLLEGQPFIPKYFKYNVGMNKEGAPDLQPSLDQVERLEPGTKLPQDAVVVDTRPEDQFKEGHVKGAINIQLGEKFETWLGTLIDPQANYYFVAENEEAAEKTIYRAAKIGYEQNLQGVTTYTEDLKEETGNALNLERFREHPNEFTIVDVRNDSELEEGRIFENAVHIPLAELPERAGEVSTDKPVVVHCAGGYRSAAAYSILENKLGDEAEVYDLSEAVKEFSEEEEPVS